MGLGNRTVGVGERFIPDNIYAPNATAGAPAAATVGSSTTGGAKAPQAQAMSATSSSGVQENRYDGDARGLRLGNLVTNGVLGLIGGTPWTVGKGIAGALGYDTDMANRIGEKFGIPGLRNWQSLDHESLDRDTSPQANQSTPNGPARNGVEADMSGIGNPRWGIAPGPAVSDSAAWSNIPGVDFGSAPVKQAEAPMESPATPPAQDTTSAGLNTGSSGSSGGYGGMNTGVGSGFNTATWGMGSSSTPTQSSESSDYAEGGMVGLRTGVPTPTGMPQQGPRPDMHPDMAQGAIARASADPRIKQKVMQAVQMGKVTPEQLHMLGQIAQACLQNPALWPQLRQFAVQKGLCGPNDMPPTYNQRMVMMLLAASKAAEGMPQGQEQQQGIEPPPGMGQGSGGLLHGPGTGTSDSIPAKNLADGGQVNVSDGEFVIPANVVRAKGKDFFDNLIRKYHQPEGFKG